MADLDRNKLRRLDLTVLLIFLGLMRLGKATDVAGELGLTNSSISHALRRLRDVFGDELFLRRPHGLEPTAFAERIEPEIARAVASLQTALAGPAEFLPEAAEDTLRISANDRETASLIPRFFARLSGQAPGLRLSVQSLSNAEGLRGLASGTLDFAIGFFRDPGPDYLVQPLRTETYVVTARRGHPIFRGPLTVESYVAAAHVLVSGDGKLSGIVDQTLEKAGLARRVCLAVPSFLPALSILSDSDFVATLPANLVRQHAAVFHLDHCPPPIEIRPFEVSVLIHRRNRRSPLHQWCLGKFQSG
jgi:DNA-binding transcriptional LysR family regulator